MELILPLTKSPHSAGRIGKKEYQDWYRGLVLAKNLLREPSSEKIILVLSKVHITGSMSEKDIYEEALRSLGVPAKNVMTIFRAQETIEQLEIAFEIAEEFEKVTIISTFAHYPRVRWLCRGKKNIKHMVAWGIPRPKEFITDLILIPLFPLIDMFGKREWFLRKVQSRRIQGRH